MNLLKPKSKSYLREELALHAIKRASEKLRESSERFAVIHPNLVNEIMIAVIASEGRFYPVFLPTAEQVQLSIELCRETGFMTLRR